MSLLCGLTSSLLDIENEIEGDGTKEDLRVITGAVIPWLLCL